MTLPAHTPPGLKLAMAWEQHCVGHPPSVGHFTLVNCHGLFEPIEELVPPLFQNQVRLRVSSMAPCLAMG